MSYANQWPSFSFGGTHCNVRSDVSSNKTGYEEWRYYLAYMASMVITSICILPSIAYAKQYTDKYPNTPPQEQSQLFATAQWIYGSGIFIVVASVVSKISTNPDEKDSGSDVSTRSSTSLTCTFL